MSETEQSINPDVLRYSRELANQLAQALGDRLVGVYVHGSAVLGDFTPSRSDVDILAVSTDSLPDTTRNSLRGALSPSALPCPGSGLEFSIVDQASLREVNAAPRFEAHIATETESGSERFVDGHGQRGDTDLVLHYAVLGPHGVSVLGPPAAEIFPKVPRPLVLEALRGELEWAIENASPSYQVLNAARAWRFAEENVICSKTEGGEWARLRVADSTAIDGALRHRQGASEEHPDETRARAFVEEVVTQLDASHAANLRVS